MNQSVYWLDALPPDAPERELFLAAERDLPPPGSIDRGWGALCASAAITSASLAVSTLAAASSPTAGTAGPSAPILASKGVVWASAAAASKTTAGLWGLPVAVKSIAIGFAVGMGALGTGEIVQSLSRREPPTIAAVAPAEPQHSERPRRPSSTVRSSHTTDIVRESDVTQAREHDIAQARQPHLGSAPNATVEVKRVNSELGPPRPRRQPSESLAVERSTTPLPVAEAPLSLQAAELAKIKGLLDSGAPREALASLRASLDAHALSAIAEDRDALYIEALKRTNHLAEARRAVESFVARYPHSPQRNRLRALVDAK